MPHSVISPWFSLAAHSLDACDRPVAVIDGKGSIVLVNRAVESLFGRAREELIGSSWISALVTPQDGARTHRIEQELLAGDRTSAVLETSARGARVMIEITRVPASILLFTIEVRHLSTQDHELPPEGNLVEEIELHLGAGRRFEIASAAGGSPLAGKMCYAELFGRDTPCPQCPASGMGEDEHERVTVVRANGSYHVLRASRTDRETAIVKRQVIEEDLCRQLVAARFDALADQAGLSRQERNVLELIVLGRSHGDIAEVLAITERTVRFHQGNLLAKLGAESRADLLRLLL